MAHKPMLGAIAVLACVAAAVAVARPVPGAPKCPIFPANSHWNLPVDDLPVLKGSTQMIRGIGADDTLHPDFGSGKYEGAKIGIPFVVVSKSTKRKRVSFDYADESDRVRYPIPNKPPIEGGNRSDGDRHILMVDKDACKLYELYAAYPRNGGSRWHAGSGAVWNLRSNKMRPAGWT